MDDSNLLEDLEDMDDTEDMEDKKANADGLQNTQDFSSVSAWTVPGSPQAFLCRQDRRYLAADHPQGGLSSSSTDEVISH